MNELERKTLLRLIRKAIRELDEAYHRYPDVNNGKAYLHRGRERIKLMLKILEG